MQASDEAPNGHTIVRLEPGERLDRDFILRLAVAQHGQVASSLSASRDDSRADQGTFTLTLLPPADAALPRPRDMAIVLDRSGSMSGWKMVAARRAAHALFDTLTAADRFAVLCFDNVTERPPGLPAGLAVASDRHRFRAVEHLARTEARGGTELSARCRMPSGCSSRTTGGTGFSSWSPTARSPTRTRSCGLSAPG